MDNQTLPWTDSQSNWCQETFSESKVSQTVPKSVHHNIMYSTECQIFFLMQKIGSNYLSPFSLFIVAVDSHFFLSDYPYVLWIWSHKLHSIEGVDSTKSRKIEIKHTSMHWQVFKNPLYNLKSNGT